MGKKPKRRAQKDKRTGVPPAARSRLEIGDQVILQDLRTQKYNRKQGKVVSLPKQHDPESRYGILVDGASSPVGVRPQNVSLSTGQSTQKSTEEQREERKKLEAPTKSGLSMNADQLEMARMVSSMLMTDEIQIEMFGRKIEPMPNYCQELLDSESLPPGVDYDWGVEYLRMSFEQSNNLPHFFEMVIKKPEYNADTRHLLKRLGTNDRRKLEWYFEPKLPGSIFPGTRTAYSRLIRHSYSNQTYRKEVLHLGTTHVAVGFVDLGILLEAILQDAPTSENSGPLHFVGIEMSAYAVAKTHVVWEMLKQTTNQDNHEEHLRRIMQVWFSTSWTKGTEEAVRTALRALCDSSKEHGYAPAVCNILNHWKCAPTMPLKEARSQYAREKSNSVSEISQLRRKCDRIAMAKYELTGDFGVQGKPCSGNILMFDCPNGTPPLYGDEVVFSALKWAAVVDHLSPKNNIIDAAEEYALSMISKVAYWAQTQLVTVDLLCAKVEDVIQDIKAAKPWTMSWSNVLDYINYDDFHRIARDCSIHGDTIHFGYSMNWVTDVFGTCIIDYQGKEHTKARAEIIDLANNVVKGLYKESGWDKYLRLPPPSNPINTTSCFLLEMRYFREWVQHFFQIARGEGPCQILHMDHPIGSPLSNTGASTVSFTWTYDPDIVTNEC